MASENATPTLADYVVLVLSPALLTGLVGSLTFFLLEILYQGAYEARLQWTLFFFVFGAVLVARISMIGEIAGRAWLYGPVLALLTWLVLQNFVEYPPDSPAAPFRALINAGLVAVIWWATYRLTWDCTHIDDDGEPTARGLLEAAGLEEERGTRNAERGTEESEREGDPPGVWGWVARYRRYREKKKRRRVLGVWVVYFALATLPIFGLGQSLIPAEDAGRRQYAFWLMTLYAGSALGLLMTTCFLGLRRYLRMRNVRMPAAMTAFWLASGGGLVLLLLVLGALLPRPRAEYRWIDFTPLGSEERQASKGSPRNDATGKDRGQPGNKPGETDRGGAKDGKAAPGEQDKDGGRDKGSKDRGGRDKKDGSAKDGKGAKRQDADDASRATDNDTPSPSALRETLEKLAPLVKWLVFGLVALLVLLGLLRNGLRFLANFTKWARELLDFLRNFWARLFGGETAAVARQGREETSEEAVEARPFVGFRNPWADGTAGQRSLRELIRYSFAALQAWAAERGVVRALGETPLEFCERVAEEAPGLADDARRLVALYVRAVYAKGKLPAAATEEVRRFWQRLERAAEQPLSA